MRLLRSIVQLLMLSMFDRGHQALLRDAVAFHLVRGHDSSGPAAGLERFAQKILRCALIAVVLHEDINHLPLGINCSPLMVATTLSRCHLSTGGCPVSRANFWHCL